MRSYSIISSIFFFEWLLVRTFKLPFSCSTSEIWPSFRSLLATVYYLSRHWTQLLSLAYLIRAKVRCCAKGSFFLICSSVLLAQALPSALSSSNISYKEFLPKILTSLSVGAVAKNCSSVKASSIIYFFLRKLKGRSCLI